MTAPMALPPSSPWHLPLPVDHAGYGVGNLGAAIELFEKLGFSPTAERQLMAQDPETGAYQPLGQVSAHLVFEQGYLELSAPTGAVADNPLIPLVKRYPGIHILAIATGNAQKQHQYCRQWYPGLPAVAGASRAIEYGKQHGSAHFKWFPLPATAFPEGIVCFVEHRSRDLVFQREVLTHPNGVVALAGIALLSKNPKAVADRYKPFIVPGHGIPRVHENACLRLVAGENLPGEPAESEDAGPGPSCDESLIGLDLETTSLASVRARLVEQSLNFHEYPALGIRVPLPSLNSFIVFRQA